MQRLKLLPHKPENERGAVAVIVVILIVALIGVGAVAVDIGRIAAEKAQLQNGADASALAIALYCSKNASTCQSNGTSLANQYTPANSNDRSAVVSSVTFPSTNSVTVNTSTPSAGLSLGFAHALGISSEQVQATATATWGPLGGGTGFPLALSSACFDIGPGSPAGQMQDFSYKPGNGPNAAPVMTCTNASGQSTTGGWGWLQESSPCSVTTTAGGTVGSDTGANPASPCQSTLQGWMNTLQAGGTVTVQFPVFSQTAYNGNNAQYTILGYATLKVIGWQFSATGVGNIPYWYNSNPPAGYPNLACSGGSNRCIIGQFIRFDASTSSSGPGGQDFGTDSYYLSK